MALAAWAAPVHAWAAACSLSVWAAGLVCGPRAPHALAGPRLVAGPRRAALGRPAARACGPPAAVRLGCHAAGPVC